MQELLDPKMDFIFKNIFGNKTNKGALISLLNAVLGYRKEEGNHIKEVTIDDSIIKKESIEDKYAVLDIKATLENGTRINIEMQMIDQYNMEQRTLYYLSRLYSEQLQSGGAYEKLNKSIAINILNYNMIKNEKYHNNYLFKERETNEIFSELMQVHFIELKKLNKTPKEINDDLESWMEFLIEPTEEVVEMLAEKVPEIKQAFEILRVVSMDKKTREDYRIREKALSDKISNLAGAKKEGIEIGIEIGKKEGIREGIKEGVKQTALGLLNAGVGVEIIIKATGLTREEIEKLR